VLKLDNVRNHEMKVVKDVPPNAVDIEKIFPGVTAPERKVLFAWGNIIYNPGDISIPAQLLAHEAVHSLQHAKRADGPDGWWYWYLKDPVFRISQELEAHRVEFEEFSEHNNRNFRKGYLKDCAKRLGGPLYGNIITWQFAKKLITMEEDCVELRKAFRFGTKGETDHDGAPGLLS